MRRREQGDTIIEVLLAIAVLGMLVTITYTSMTRAMAIAYNSLDRTNTQAMVNGQANMLRAAHDKYITAVTPADKAPWQQIVALVRSDANSFAATPARDDGCTMGVPNAQAFYFDPALNPSVVGLDRLQPIDGSSQPISEVRDISTDPSPKLGNGLWIEGYRMTFLPNGSRNDNVYSFYIKSCTPAIFGDGSDIDRQSKTVVRLYAE